MQTKERIGYAEAVALVATTIASKVYLSYPTAIQHIAGSAAWLLVLLTAAVAWAGFLLGAILLERFPGKSLIGIAEAAGGPVTGVITGSILTAGILVMMATSLREFAENMIITALPETPISAIIGLFMLSIAIAVYLGLEIIARTCYVSFLFTLGAVLAIVFLNIDKFNVNWLFPLLGKGMDKILPAALYRSSDYWELLVLALIAPAIKETASIRRIGRSCLLISAAVFTLVALANNLILSPAVAEEPYLLLYELARSVYLGRFVQRVEAIFVLIWGVGALQRLAVGFYLLVAVPAESLRLKDYRPFIAPLGILLFAVTFTPGGASTLFYLENHVLRTTAWIPYFLLPGLLLLLAAARGKGGKNDAVS
ncbi:MAG: GerAB/ArcD/ProY family transporter [bacterium]|jgi:spore germination protein KB